MQLLQEHGESIILSLLFALNLALCFGFLLPVINTFAKILPSPKIRKRFLLTLGLYLTEIFALAMGMGIPAFNVALAFLWGTLLGRYLKNQTDLANALKISTRLAFYSSLPAMSFLVIPILMLAASTNIISIQTASDMGIPSFFPWPTNTILGFYSACALGALALKILITNACVKFIFKRNNKARTQHV
jgi:hypothetical protein